MPDCLNDINVVDVPPVLDKIFSVTYPPPASIALGVRRNKPYWLCDIIYPDWPVDSYTIMNHALCKNKNFARVQEAARKNIVMAFGVT